MEDTQNSKKIVIVLLVIILLIGIIMMINLLKKDELPENNIANNTSNSIKITDDNTNTTETNNIVENNEIQEENAVEENISNESVIEKVRPVYLPSSNDKEVIYTNNSKTQNNNNNDNLEFSNRDVTAPLVNIKYSIAEMTDKNVIVTITANENIQGVESWNLSSDLRTLTKEYSNNISEVIKIKDIAGNEIPVDIEITNIDKENPELSTVSKTVFDTKEINTMLTLKDNLSGIDLEKSFYKIDNIEEMDNDISSYSQITSEKMQVTKTVKEDGIYYLHIISVDKVGNTTKNTIKLYVDTIMPKITVQYSETAYTKNNVVVKIIANKPMQEIEGWNLSENKMTFTKTYTENKVEKVILTDMLGRTIETTVTVENIDRIEPEEPSLSKTVFNSKPIDNSKNINISLDATLKDNESGVNLSESKYILNGSNEKITDFSSAKSFNKENQTLNFTIKENSVYYLHVLVKDNVGNSRYTIHTIISDTLNPIVTREYSNKEITNQNVIVTVKSNEILQGKENWQVFDGGKTLKREYTQNVGRTVETFYDLAGNPVGVDIQISNIDKVSPSEATISKTEFNTKDINLKVNLSDDYSGIDLDKCKYVLNSSKTTDYSNAKTFTKTAEELKFNVNKDGIYYLHILSVDKAGNETDTIKEIKVDTTSPEYKVEYSNTDITNDNVVVKIVANEELKSLSGWTLSSDKKVLEKTFSSNTNTNVTITDSYGNTSIVDIIIKNIDKKVPNAEVIYSTTSQTSKNVVVTIKADEKIVNTNGWTLSSDGLTLTKTFSKNATETVTIKDLAGNYTTVSVIVANII